MSETMTLELIDVYEWHCCESVPPDPKTEIHDHMALAVARAVRELVELKCERDALRAEIAALRARIADAPVATLVFTGSGGDLMLLWAENPDEWVGKDVRLVVDEPQDDNAQEGRSRE